MSYPDGKISEDDMGALAVAVYIDKGRVIIDFGKDLSWIGMGKENLRGFIDMLEQKYKLL